MFGKNKKSPAKNRPTTKTNHTVNFHETSSTSSTHTRSVTYSETRTYNGEVLENTKTSSTNFITRNNHLPVPTTRPALTSSDASNVFNREFGGNSQYQSPYRSSSIFDARPLYSTTSTSITNRPIATLPTSSSTSRIAQPAAAAGYRPISSLSTPSTFGSSQNSSGYRPLSSFQPSNNNYRPLTGLQPLSSTSITPPSRPAAATTQPSSTKVSLPSTVSEMSKILSNPLATTVERVALTEATKAFANKNKNGKLEKIGPGIAYIFNHDKFDNANNEERKGTQKDVDKLKKTFQSFKMESKVCNNYKVKDIEAEVAKMQKHDFSKKSCIVIVILTHGTRHDVVSAKDNHYSLDDVILFPLLQNITLKNKPKILIVQACKGDNATERYDYADARKTYLNPPLEIAKLYSTFEGFLSYRGESGSLFIQILCQNLEKDGFRKTIVEIMQDTIKEIVNDYKALQVPTITHNMTIPLIFGNYVTK